MAVSKFAPTFAHNPATAPTAEEALALGTTVHLREVVFRAHWDSGWPDSYALYATYRRADGEWVETQVRGSDTGCTTPLAITTDDAVLGAWREHFMDTIVPARAHFLACEQLGKRREQIENDIRAIEYPSEVRRGETWVVVKGRKFAHGTVGKVFWVGTNRWGTSAGIATSDRRDAQGRNLDAIFVSTSNLRKVLDDAEDCRVAQLRQQLDATVVGSPAFDAMLVAQTQALRTQWNEGQLSCPLWRAPKPTVGGQVVTVRP